MSTLFVIGTPIGNMEDITLRALKALASADLILCEDTRVTKRLLERHGIKTPTMSYHAHSKLSKVEQIIGLLKEGKDLALVSDAGTPSISDPGAELVAEVRRSAPEAKIEAVPGPSALAAALSVAGIPVKDGFTFLGFLPHKKGRETLFMEMASSERPTVFYESPHRIMKTLGSLEKHLKTGLQNGVKAENGKKIAVCRELTKIFEEVVSGTPSDVSAYFRSNPDKVRGEFVVIVSDK